MLAQLLLIAVVARYSSVFLAIHIAGFFISLLWYLKVSGPAQSADVKSRAAMRAYHAELTTGLRHFKAFGWQSQALEKGGKLLAKSQDEFYYRRSIDRWMYFAVEGSRSLAGIAVVILIAVCRAPIPALALGLMLVLPMKAEDSTMILVEDCAVLRNSFQTLGTLLEFLDETPPESNAASKEYVLDSNWPHKGRITFKNVTAKYK